jgi:hypothetical protein
MNTPYPLCLCLLTLLFGCESRSTVRGYDLSYPDFSLIDHGQQSDLSNIIDLASSDRGVIQVNDAILDAIIELDLTEPDLALQDMSSILDMETAIDMNIPIRSARPTPEEAPQLWTDIECPAQQRAINGHCPRLLDAARWMLDWPEASDILKGSPLNLCDPPWRHGSELNCEDSHEGVNLSALPLGVWMNTRQRASRDDHSLTLPITPAQANWSVDFEITLLSTIEGSAEIGQSFAYIGIIDEGEVPSSGYPGAATGLYLPLGAPPRLYDRGQAGPNSSRRSVELNQTYRYTLSVLSGELWVSKDQVLLSRKALRMADAELRLGYERLVSALRISCVNCTAKVQVHQVLRAEVPTDSISLPQNSTNTDGTNCTQHLINPRFERDDGGFPTRWSLYPALSLELSPTLWRERMGQSIVSHVVNDVGESIRRMSVASEVQLRQPLYLPAESCEGLVLTLHDLEGTASVMLNSLQSTSCPNQSSNVSCVIHELSPHQYFIAHCPSGPAELKITPDDDNALSINALSLNLHSGRLTEDGDWISSEPLPTLEETPCDPDRALSERQISIEQLTDRGMAQHLSLSFDEYQHIPLWIVDENQPRMMEQSALSVMMKETYIQLRLSLPSPPKRFQLFLRLNDTTKPLKFWWHESSGILDAHPTEWNNDHSGCDETLEEPCEIILSLPWSAIAAKALAPEVQLDLLVVTQTEQILALSDVAFSPYGLMWGGVLGGVVLTGISEAILDHTHDALNSLTPSPTPHRFRPLAFAPVVPMRRTDTYWDEHRWGLLNELGFKGVSVGNPHQNWIPLILESAIDIAGGLIDFNLFYGVNFWRDGDLRQVYLEIAQSLANTLADISNNALLISLTLLDEPLIHPLRRCVDDLSSSNDWSNLRSIIMTEVEEHCGQESLGCSHSIASQICREVFPALITELAEDVAQYLGEQRIQVSIGVNLTGDLGLKLAEELAEQNVMRLNSAIDHLSFTNNWVGYDLPLRWSDDADHTSNHFQTIDPRIHRVGYSLFSGPNGGWRVLRSPNAQEARAMSLSLLAEGAEWQRIFAWPPNHALVAEGLGELNRSLHGLSALHEGHILTLPTSHHALKAKLFYTESEAILIIINRDALPMIGSVTLTLPWIRERSERSILTEISPLLTARVEEPLDQSALLLTPQGEGPASLTLTLKGWDAHLYDIPR